jgi:hypothetical protein
MPVLGQQLLGLLTVASLLVWLGILHQATPAMVQLPQPTHNTTQTPSTVGDECMFEDPIEVAIPLLAIKGGESWCVLKLLSALPGTQDESGTRYTGPIWYPVHRTNLKSLLGM